jgi:hypothetical protein
MTITRRRPQLRSRQSVAVLGVLLLLALTACRSPHLSLRRHPPAHLTGRILATVAGPSPRLLELDLSSGRWQSIPLPASPISAFFWGNPPSAYALLRGGGGTSRLVEAGVGGKVRTVLSSVPADVQSNPHPIGGLVAIGTCQGTRPVFVLNLTTGGTPREVGRGCPAALSPDGRSVAYSPDLLSVWRVGLEGASRPAPMFRLAGPVLASLGMRQPRILPEAGMSWGRGGLAMAVEGEGRFACLLATGTGRVRVIPLGTARPTQFAWDPGGTFLAFIELDRTGGALRVYDAASGRRRLAALALGKQLQGLVWSPMGDTLLTLKGGDRWLIVTPAGSTVRSIAVPVGAIPWDWMP